jgi:hypothetical protein
VPTVQSRYEVASSKSVRSDILAPPRHNIPYHAATTTHIHANPTHPEQNISS